jgi:hypothetical protein
MEMEEECLSSRLWKWKRTVWQTLIAIMSYSLHNNVLQLTQQCLTTYTTMSYSLHNSVLQLTQQCLTAYTTVSYNLHNSVLQLICGKVGVFPGYLKLLFTLSTYEI